VILLAAREAGLPVAAYALRQIKIAVTGNGNAAGGDGGRANAVGSLVSLVSLGYSRVAAPAAVGDVAQERTGGDRGGSGTPSPGLAG
jgi:hypothetical protein